DSGINRADKLLYLAIDMIQTDMFNIIKNCALPDAEYKKPAKAILSFLSQYLDFQKKNGSKNNIIDLLFLANLNNVRKLNLKLFREMFFILIDPIVNSESVRLGILLTDFLKAITAFIRENLPSRFKQIIESYIDEFSATVAQKTPNTTSISDKYEDRSNCDEILENSDYSAVKKCEILKSILIY
ncbi:MAG: hypothetical protein MHMPM18_003397, partial [Marteilia pararefringens]